MSENTPNFLKSITFEEDFPPFKKWTPIEFWGEKEVQNMIEFYLKHKNNSPENTDKKSDEEISDNAKRFKINCVLGNNWGGKSRLFEWILEKEDILNNTAERKNKYWDFYDKWWKFFATESFYYQNNNNSFNICDTKKIQSSEKTNKLLANLKWNNIENEIYYDNVKNKIKDLHKDHDDKLVYQENTPVWEIDYLKDVWENFQEIMKFSNILNENWKIKYFTFLLDDFFKLSWNIKNSVNNNLLNGKKYNKFYCDLFNDIWKFKDIYSWFLNIWKDFKTLININFINWKHNYKWDYFDFLNNNSDYNWEIDNRNVKDEINFWESLNFFELLAKTYNEEDTRLHKFWIKKEEAKEIWFYLSELFLLTVNHFDEYLSLDDEFTKEMVEWRQRMSGTSQPWFEEKWLFAYDSYSDYKKSLNLLETYLKINIELLNKNIFTEYYLREQGRRKNIKTSLEKISFNLQALLNNLEKIEMEVNTETTQESKKWHIDNDKQEYPFKDISWQDLTHNDFIDKLQNSKYSSQSKYLLINLLFWYSDTDQYTSNIDKNIYDKDTIENNKNKIRDLSYYIFDWPIEYFSEKVLNNNFSYNWNSKLYENEINFISNNFINCDIEFYDIEKDNLKSFNNLSAWEKTMLTRFTNISRNIFESKKTDFLILIDEPDLHLHLDWQRQYIQKLIDVFSTLDPQINLHFIIATHSPFIISDLPKESLVLLNKGEQVDNKEIPETFWANYIDIIKNGFFFEDKKIMGSFAEDIIWEVAQSKRKILMDIPDKNDKEIMNQIEENIWDKFLKNNLVYFKSKKYDKSWD